MNVMDNYTKYSKLQGAGVTLNAEKCDFHKEEAKFLGVIINKDGVRADPDKTKPI